MALIVLSGVLLPVAVIAGWANSTIYESEEFSDRVVALLDSATVRHEMAARLTEQLARGGNQQAVNFRPAFELAVEAGINTDTFRSIFRTAVQRTHEALLEGESTGGAGLNLSDSIAIITSSLQLPGSAEPGAQSSSGLSDSLTDVTDRLDSYRFWQWQDITGVLLLGGFLGAVLAATVGIILALDRRRAVHRLGWAVVIGAALLFGLVQFVRWLAGRLVSDPGLSDAVKSAVSTGMADLRLIALWLVGYGVIVIAASSPSERRYTPRWALGAGRRWIDRRRASTRGRVFLGVGGLLLSVMITSDPVPWLTTAVFLGALWLGYLSVLELLSLVRARVDAGARTGRPRWRHAVAVAAVVVVVGAVVSAGLVITTTRAAKRAAAEGERKCNGDIDNCDRTLAEITLPGSHNAMSSTLYPGWLFAEQIDTIKGQLDAGVRALLIDTHYGVASSSRMPGTKTAVVLTDRAAELAQPPGDDYDPAIAQRAAQLAARAPASANATRQIYLCHNYCEMGAVSFASVLNDVKQFVDTHPDDVVTLVIQDATTPADTAAAIEAAGLGEHAYTLERGQPLPTLSEMIDRGKTLLVFAEQGGSGAPPWYQKAYDWFQETRYDFKTPADFTCAPNRGSADAPLFLVNHWVTVSPPDPAKAAQANAVAPLRNRLQQCAEARDRVPNIVAVDFSVRAKIASTVRDVAESLRDRVRRASSTPSTTAASTTTTTAPPPTTVPVEPVGALPDVTQVTTLTGGDPVQFCSALVAAAPVLSAWAYAEFTGTPAQQGEADLVYGPALERLMGSYVAAAPVELAQLAQPLLARAEAASATLKQLGLDDDAVAALAEQAVQATSVTAAPDGVTLQTTLAATIAKQVGQDKLAAAASAFSAAQGDPSKATDFGFVDDNVAAASGYDICPDVTIR